MGAQFGYSAIWVLVLACILMVGMVALATRIGLGFDETPCGELANRLGRPVAALVGITMFLIIASFQSSNNIAVVASFESFDWKLGKVFSVAVLCLVNVGVIIFLLTSRDLYRIIETAMKILVLLMVLAFLVNCVFARPSLVAATGGLIPRVSASHSWKLVALVGTTFSVAAAFYQGYLVREKGWTQADLRKGFFDSVIGIVTLGGITLVIMMTSAAVFHDKGATPELTSAVDVAAQLKPLFGSWAQYVFGIGIFAGAISSFLVNALIGGHILADGFGLGDRINSKWTQYFTVAALLLGMTVALLAISTGMSRVQLIVFAQALTVVGVPALAIAMLFLGIIKWREDKSSMPVWILVIAGVGFGVTGLLATRTVISIIERGS